PPRSLHDALPISYQGRALPTELHGRTGFARAREAKVPEPPFERPWDRFVQQKASANYQPGLPCQSKFLADPPARRGLVFTASTATHDNKNYPDQNQQDDQRDSDV